MFATAYYPGAHDFHHLINSFAAPYAYQAPCPPRRRHVLARPQYVPEYATHYYVVPAAKPKPRAVNIKLDPRVSLTHDDNEYNVHMEVPGFSKSQITIDYHDNVLQVSGKRTEGEDEAATEIQQQQQQQQEKTDLTTEASLVADKPAAEEAVESRGRSSSPSGPKRTSIEVVRDESESEYVEVPSSIEQTPKSQTEVGQSQPAEQNKSTTTVATRPEEQEPRSQSPQKRPLEATSTAAEPCNTWSFEKSFDIPKDVNQDDIAAELKDGILRVRFARVRPQAHSRRIMIQ